MSILWYQLSRPSRVLCSFSLLILLQPFLSLPATAQIYQCVLNGVPTFSDEPCEGTPAKIIPAPPPPTNSAASAGGPRVDANLRRRQLHVIVAELNNGNHYRAQQHARDYGIDFDRVYTQWKSVSARQIEQQKAEEQMTAAQAAERRAVEAEERAARAEQRLKQLNGLGGSVPEFMPGPRLPDVTLQHTNCMGNCASEQGMCIGQCRGVGQCIARCAERHGRCIPRCPL